MSAVTAHEALERRLAARALLVSPIMTPAEHAEELALVRRHAKALREMFYSRFGYVLPEVRGQIDEDFGGRRANPTRPFEDAGDLT